MSSSRGRGSFHPAATIDSTCVASCFIYFHTGGLFFLLLLSLIHICQALAHGPFHSLLFFHPFEFYHGPTTVNHLMDHRHLGYGELYILLHLLLLTSPFLQSSTIPLHGDHLTFLFLQSLIRTSPPTHTLHSSNWEPSIVIPWYSSPSLYIL